MCVNVAMIAVSASSHKPAGVLFSDKMMAAVMLQKTPSAASIIQTGAGFRKRRSINVRTVLA